MRHNKPQHRRLTYVRFDEETHDKLRVLADRDDRTVAHVIRLAVEQYLARRKSSAA